VQVPLLELQTWVGVMQPAPAVKKMAKMKKQTVISKAPMQIKMMILWAERLLTCLMRMQQKMSQHQTLMMTHRWTPSLMMEQLPGSKMVSIEHISLQLLSVD